MTQEVISADHCITHKGVGAQDVSQRPDFPEIKQRLLQFASENFQCPADEALRLKHTKERALLDQILPPQVS